METSNQKPSKNHMLQDREQLARLVLAWYRKYGRDFPWRNTADPFAVLVAEVLLRQTQAPRVVATYKEIVSLYPDAASLVGADLSWLKRLFIPLGLFSRSQYLVRIAKRLVEFHKGEVPSDESALRALPGVGRYATNAILCLAFGKPVPMVDEAVGRLLRRVLGLSCVTPAYEDSGLWRIAGSLVPQENPKAFNLGLLDIATILCRKRKPNCNECPLTSVCEYSLGRNG